MKIIPDKKIMLLLVGPSGAGKSTFIKENYLEQFTISMDTLRLIIGGVELTENTNFGESITQKYNKEVAELYYQLLEQKMSREQFIVCDNTHLNTSFLQQYNELAEKYGYEVYYITFFLDKYSLYERNLHRGYKMISEAVIEKQLQFMEKWEAPYGWKRIIGLEELPNYICYDPKNLFELSEIYKSIYFIGDIQGCYHPFQNFISEEFSEKSLYVFTGDFIDRGPENDKVVELLYNLASTYQENCIFLKGNHDEYLLQYSNNGRNPVGRKEFDTNTLPQLSSLPDHIFTYLKDQFSLAFIGKFCGKILFASHGGVNKITSFISRRQLVRGVGEYTNHQSVDEAFNDWSKTEWSGQFVSIHGHRNSDEVGIQSTEHTYNLEGGVEFGGEMRVIKFGNDGSIQHLIYKN